MLCQQSQQSNHLLLIDEDVAVAGVAAEVNAIVPGAHLCLVHEPGTQRL